MKKKLAISLITGTLISAGALFLAFRNVPAGELWPSFAMIRYGWAFPAVLLVGFAFFMRAVRWQIIVGSAYRIGLKQAFHPLMIGFMINCVLPGRVGELARPAILSQRDKVPFATGLATVAVERVFDLAMLVLFFALLLTAVPIDPELTIEFGGYRLNRLLLESAFDGMAALGLALVVGLIALNIGAVRGVVAALLRRAPGWLLFLSAETRRRLAERVSEPLVRLVDRVADGFLLIRRPRRVAGCILASALIWLSHALSYYVFALGNPAIPLSFLQLSATMIIIMFFIALPSVPGYWGLWEAGGVFALALFGVPARDAAPFTLANHVIQILPVVALGAVSAIVTSINVLQISYGAEAR
jgi:hypothetical protein